MSATDEPQAERKDEAGEVADFASIGIEGLDSKIDERNANLKGAGRISRFSVQLTSTDNLLQQRAVSEALQKSALCQPISRTTMEQLGAYLPLLAIRGVVDELAMADRASYGSPAGPAGKSPINRARKLSSSSTAGEESDHAEPFMVPRKETFTAAVLFADVSGFTAMSELLNRQLGRRGPEKLATALTSYLDRMTKSLAKGGGEVIKFVGDALLVVFTNHDRRAAFREAGVVESSSLHKKKRDQMHRRTSTKIVNNKDGSSYEDADEEGLVHAAIQCALDLQEECHNAEVVPGCRLSVKVGIGVGKCSALHIGDHSRLEYVLTGGPLHQAFFCESEATPGDIIVSGEALAWVKDDVEAVTLPAGVGKVTRLKERSRLQSLALVRQALFGHVDVRAVEELSKYQQAYNFCVVDDPAMDKWLGRLQPLSVIFMNLGFKGNLLVNAGTTQGMKRFNDALCAVLEGLRATGASLHKLMVDDKGATLIGTVGLPEHRDTDPLRAVRAGLTVLNNLNSLQPPLKPSIGITSSVCFVGKIGNHIRRELAILGDRVNLAARLMAAASKRRFGVAGSARILCDLDTCNEVSFRYGGERSPLADPQHDEASDPEAASMGGRAKGPTGRKVSVGKASVGPKNLSLPTRTASVVDGRRVRNTNIAFQSMGTIMVKGKTEPVSVFRPFYPAGSGGNTASKGITVRPLQMAIYPDEHGSAKSFHSVSSAAKAADHLKLASSSLAGGMQGVDFATLFDQCFLKFEGQSSPQLDLISRTGDAAYKKGSNLRRSKTVGATPNSSSAAEAESLSSQRHNSMVFVIQAAAGAGKTSILRSTRVPWSCCRSISVRSDASRCGQPFALWRAVFATLFGCPVKRPSSSLDRVRESSAASTQSEKASADESRWALESRTATERIRRYMETDEAWMGQAWMLNDILCTCFESPGPEAEEDLTASQGDDTADVEDGKEATAEAGSKKDEEEEEEETQTLEFSYEPSTIGRTSSLMSMIDAEDDGALLSDSKDHDLSLWSYPCSLGKDWSHFGEDRVARHRVVMVLLAKLVETVTAQFPLVISVDDADSLHQSTCLSMISLLRRRDAPGMIFLLTVSELRSEVLQSILSRPRTHLIVPKGVTDRELDERIISPELHCVPGCVTPRLLNFCKVMSGGNPMLATHLIRDLRASGVLRFEQGSRQHGNEHHDFLRMGSLAETKQSSTEPPVGGGGNILKSMSVGRSSAASTKSGHRQSMMKRASSGSVGKDVDGSDLDPLSNGFLDIVDDFDFLRGLCNDDPQAVESAATGDSNGKSQTESREVDLLTMPVELLVSSTLGGLDIHQRLILSCIAAYQVTRQAPCPLRVLQGIVHYFDQPQAPALESDATDSDSSDDSGFGQDVDTKSEDDKAGGAEEIAAALGPLEQDVLVCMQRGIITEVAVGHYVFRTGYGLLTVVRQTLAADMHRLEQEIESIMAFGTGKKDKRRTSVEAWKALEVIQTEFVIADEKTDENQRATKENAECYSFAARKAFEFYDKDKSGAIDRDEVSPCLENLNNQLVARIRRYVAAALDVDR